MEKYFATYNQSLALKELGFDEPCMGKYDTKQGDEWFLNIYSGHLNIQFGDKSKACIAPLRSQVFEWFRKEHKLHGNIIIAETNCGFKIQYLSDYINQWFASYESYEEAESACIDQLIEIVKNKTS